MSSGTEREETRKVATLCVVSSGGQCTCSYVMHWLPSDILFFRLLRHPSYFPLTSVCFKNWRNSRKDGNLLTTTMLSAPRVARWRTKVKNSSTMEYGLCRITGPSAFLSWCWKWQNIMFIFCCWMLTESGYTHFLNAPRTTSLELNFVKQLNYGCWIKITGMRRYPNRTNTNK